MSLRKVTEIFFLGVLIISILQQTGPEVGREVRVKRLR